MKYGIARDMYSEELELKVRQLEEYGCDQIVQFQGQWQDTDQAQETAEKLKAGDELIACTLACLSRDPESIVQLLKQVEHAGAEVVFLSEHRRKNRTFH